MGSTLLALHITFSSLAGSSSLIWSRFGTSVRKEKLNSSSGWCCGIETGQQRGFALVGFRMQTLAAFATRSLKLRHICCSTALLARRFGFSLRISTPERRKSPLHPLQSAGGGQNWDAAKRGFTTRRRSRLRCTSSGIFGRREGAESFRMSPWMLVR